MSDTFSPYYCDGRDCEWSHKIRLNPLYAIESLAVTKAVGTVSRLFTWSFEPDLQQLLEILYDNTSVPIDTHLELCLKRNS